MKTMIFASLVSLVSLSAAAAPLAVYNCTLQGGKLGATLVYYPEQVPVITWMPADGLNTTKANVKGQLLNNGETQFALFGFQDQVDFLFLPPGAAQLPAKMEVYTYHDNDDQAEDMQKFDCVK